MTLPDFLKTPQALPLEKRDTTFPYQRFFSKFDKRPDIEEKLPGLGGCWEWTRALHPKGYGVFWLGNGTQMIHRVAFEYKYGPIPQGLILLHRCDNRKCGRVDPDGPPELDHFYLGTEKENNTDRDLKARGVTLVGSANPASRVTADDVRNIRRQYATGKVTLTQLGVSFAISPSAVGRIVRGESWQHIV